MGQPTFTVLVDNVGTPHTFIKLDDGNGSTKYYGFAPETAGSAHGPGGVGQGLTTHVMGDPQNNAAGYIDDVGWSKTIAITPAQYKAMDGAVASWRDADHTYDGLRLFGGENCTGFVQFVAQAGGVTDINMSRAVLPINLIPVGERAALFTVDADGRRSPSDALTNPLHTPGTPAYEYKQQHPEMFVPNGASTQDPDTSSLHWNTDGSFTQEIVGTGASAGDVQQTEVASNGHVTQVTETDGARDNTDYTVRTTAYDAQGRIDSINTWEDGGGRTWLDYDQNNADPMARWEQHFDAQGREDWRNVVQDDGGRDWTDFDQFNASTISRWEQHFDAQGREDWRNVVQDDGGRDWTDFDQFNASTISRWEQHFDAQGREDWRNVVQDDGGRDWTDFDQFNASTISRWEQHFDAQGREDWRNVVQDDGGRDWTDFDQFNASTISRWEQHFDAQGREDWRNVVQDDGGRDWTDFDQFNASTISRWEQHFDAQGREDWRNVVQDDSSRNLYDYDQSGSQSWSRIETRFDTQGRQDSADMWVDDGSRNAYDYDQDGSRGWSRIESRFDAANHLDYSTKYFDDGSRFFVDNDYYKLNNHQLLAYDASGKATYVGEIVNGFVSNLFGSWNPAWGEGLGVQAVMQADGCAPPPGSLSWPSPFPDYDLYPNAHVVVDPLDPTI